ncbi:MAG TPA: hypothetical protein VFD63_21180 [Pyrinomonadaceae bacterium]|nr:hypothetical protein [Pyrinomonadaceae bacterium]
MQGKTRQSNRRRYKPNVLLILASFLLLHASTMTLVADCHETAPQELGVTANFEKRESISSSELIELHLSRRLKPEEESLAVFLDTTDITNLFTSNETVLSYSSQALALPPGDHTLVVYLVSGANEWRQTATLQLRVREGKKSNQLSANKPANDLRKYGFDKFEFKPSLTINLKSQSTVLFFPNNTRPDRLNFLDLGFQGSLQTNLTRGGFIHQNQFDFVGTTFQKEALQFGERDNDAPQIDLSSYLMQFQVRKVKVLLGHHAYGTNRYLIDSFSSRGLAVTVPLGSRFDFSFNATNGTSIVGWDNFSGLNQRKHKIISATVGSELFPAHPGWLRVEVGVLRGSLLPVNNFNQRNLTDAEASHGVGGRIVTTDSKNRFRIDAGYARSRFNNPADPLLDQGFSVVPVRETSRNAIYADLNYQFLKDWKATREKNVNLSFVFRYHRIDPLFRSVAVFTQADRLDYQYELTGNFGEITAGAVHNRLNDNLDDVPSVLKTLTRRNGFNISLPLVALLGNTHNYSAWLPRVSYSHDRTHAFGAFLPINSGFALTHVPDQASTNHNFNAEWAHDNLRFGYRFNQSFQDNREVGREIADFRTLVHALTFGIKPQRRLDLNFDLSSERAANLEVNRLDRALRLSFGSTFQASGNSILTTNVSSNLTSDVADTNRNRSIDLDLQWSWRFGIEKDKYRKVQGQFFIRYANRYARAQDRIFLFNNINKFQAFSAGLSITLF